MGTGRIDDETLQRYHDGELPADEAEEIRSQLLASEEEQERLSRIGRLGDLIRLAADDVGADVPSEDLFAGVQEGIVREEQERPGNRLRLVQGGRQSRQRNAVVAVLALAAAALLVYFWPRIAPHDQVAGTSPGEQPDLPVVVEEPPAGSEVEEVDFGENTGTVFAVQGEAGEPIAVVWIAEDQEAP